MTVQELSRYFQLKTTIDKTREDLAALRERAAPSSPKLTGMPHASGVNDNVGLLAVEIVELEERIQELEQEAEPERQKAAAFCASIQSARLYLIFRLRFVRCYSWAEIAYTMGKSYTETSVARMAYNYLKKTETAA